MTRILCARHPHLGLIAACRRRPELRGRPVIVGGAPELRRPVIAASAEARAMGVRPGQPLRQAQQLCPAATFVALDEAEMGRLGEAVLAAVSRLSPAVETGDEEVLCDLSGRHAALPTEVAWARAVARALVAALDGEAPAVGVAGGRLVARLAAGCSRPHRVRRVPQGGEAAFLAPLPLSVLPLGPRVAARLAALGIGSLGAVATLSPADLQRQFGPEGVTLSRLARGEDAETLTPARPPRAWVERVVLEEAVIHLEVLRFSGRRCAEALGERLRAGGWTAGSVALVLELEGGGEARAGMDPPGPVGGDAELWPCVALLLERITVPEPVPAVRLELGSLRPGAGRQVDMWRRGDASRDAIAAAVTRLRARFGDEAVRRPRLVRDPGDLPERRYTWEASATGGTRR